VAARADEDAQRTGGDRLVVLHDVRPVRRVRGVVAPPAGRPARAHRGELVEENLVRRGGVAEAVPGGGVFREEAARIEAVVELDLQVPDGREVERVVSVAAAAVNADEV